MELRDFLARIDNVKQVGAEQWHGNCPACNDKHGHLYISQSRDGVILLDCKHGCTFDEIVSAVGVEKKQLFKERTPWEFLREHIYTDGQNVTVAKKVIYLTDEGKKQAVWYRYRTGKWEKGLGGFKVPLYHLSAMVDVVKVYMAEGEKDVETLERMGLTATTSPNGAGSKLRSDLVRYFKGKDVVILSDNDETGIDFANHCAESIRPKANSVKVIKAAEIYPDVKAKGDISDIAAIVGDDEAKRLLTAAENTALTVETVVPSKPPENADEAVAFFRDRGLFPESYTFDDMGNAQLFMDLFGSELRFNTTAKEWFVFVKGHWQRDTGGMYASEKMKLMQSALGKYAQSGAIADKKALTSFESNVKRLGKLNVREAALKDARSIDWIENDRLDSDPLLLNCINGTLNLKTLKFKPHDPNDMISKISGVIYDPAAKSPEWDKFIDTVMCRDKDKAHFLQKALGYSLTGLTSEECFFILYGATTRNGKGTMTNAINTLMGDYALTANPESFAQRSNKDGRQASGDIARLAGARFVNVSEPQKNMQLDAALMKTLTGRDVITARHLHEREFQFIPQFKQWWQTNFLPTVHDQTLFSSKRVKVITFDKHFGDDERDVTLKDRLCTPENISGILNWCLEGLRMYWEEGLKSPLAVVEATLAYADSSDKLKTFINECLVSDEYSSCTAKDAYIAYKMWCKENGYLYENKSKWMQSMRSKGLVEDRGKVGNNWCYNIINKYDIASEYKPSTQCDEPRKVNEIMLLDEKSRKTGDMIDLPF